MAAAAVVPLAAAPAAHAGYLSPWFYAGPRINDGLPGAGTIDGTVAITQIPGGSYVSGTVRYTLNQSAIARVFGGYTGLGAGSVTANDRVRYTWNFTLTDSGSVPITGVDWVLFGFYDTRSDPYASTILASGNTLGTFSGTSEYTFTKSMSDLNWHGMELSVTTTVPGDRPGEYQLGANVNELSYTYVPEPSGGLLAMTAGACLMQLRRRRPAHD